MSTLANRLSESTLGLTVIEVSMNAIIPILLCVCSQVLTVQSGGDEFTEGMQCQNQAENWTICTGTNQQYQTSREQLLKTKIPEKLTSHLDYNNNCYVSVTSSGFCFASTWSDTVSPTYLVNRAGKARYIYQAPDGAVQTVFQTSCKYNCAGIICDPQFKDVELVGWDPLNPTEFLREKFPIQICCFCRNMRTPPTQHI